MKWATLALAVSSSSLRSCFLMCCDFTLANDRASQQYTAFNHEQSSHAEEEYDRLRGLARQEANQRNHCFERVLLSISNTPPPSTVNLRRQKLTRNENCIIVQTRIRKRRRRRRKTSFRRRKSARPTDGAVQQASLRVHFP